MMLYFIHCHFELVEELLTSFRQAQHDKRKKITHRE